MYTAWDMCRIQTLQWQKKQWGVVMMCDINEKLHLLWRIAIFVITGVPNFDFFSLFPTHVTRICIPIPKAFSTAPDDKFDTMKRCSVNHLIFQPTHTSWPSGQLQAFYREFISNRSYATHYRSIVDSNRTLHTDLEELRISRLISQHFVALQMYLDETTMMEYVDHPQLSFIGFISQLGGALNLRAGITVVVVIEVVELLFELCTGEFNQYKQDKHPSYVGRNCNGKSGSSNDVNSNQDDRIDGWQ